MTYAEYSPLAMKTLNDKGFELNLCHAALGIVTEIQEYYAASNEMLETAPYHQEEELGDIAWFVNLAAVLLDIDINEIEIDNTEIGEAYDNAIEFADWVKSTIIYGKEITKERKIQAQENLLNLLGLIKLESHNFSKCLEANIVKLQYKRYKKEGKYDELENFSRDLSDGINAVKEVFGKL